MNNGISRQRAIIPFLAAAGYAAFTSYNTSHFLNFFSFQVRDLERASAVARGTLIFWGPEMTGGGHLPGGLYYWLMSLPLKAGWGWQGCWILLCALWSISNGVLAVGLTRAYGAGCAMIATIFIYPMISFLVNAFLNVSALPLFTTLVFGLLCLAHTSEIERKRNQTFAGACFLTALGIQFHFSIVILLAAALFLRLLRRPLEIFSPGGNGYFLGLVAFLLPLVPYACAVVFGLGAPLPLDSGSSLDALPSLYHLAKDFWKPGFGLEVMLKLYFLIPLPLMTAIVCWRAGLPETAAQAQLRKIATVTTLVSFLPASYYILRPNGLRYTIPFETGLMVSTAAWMLPVLSQRRSRMAFLALNWILAIALGLWSTFKADNVRLAQLVFLVPALLLLLILERKREPSWTLASASAATLLSFQALFQLPLPVEIKLPLFTAFDMQALSEYVHATTGWNYEEARKRIFYVNKQMEVSPKQIYEEIAANAPSPSPHSVPDGFFATLSPVPKSQPGGIPSRKDFSTWLLAQPLQEDVRIAVREGVLELGEPHLDPPLTLVPFRVVNTEKFPSQIGNAGFSYEPSPEVNLDGYSDGNRAKMLAPGSAVFYWNECALPVCTTAAFVSFSRAGTSLRFKIRITGNPLAQSSEWTGPGWTQAWISPYLETVCDGSREKIELFESVGINPRHSRSVSGMRQTYNSFLAPIERQLTLRCSGNLRLLRVGRDSTLLFGIDGIRSLRPAPLNLPISAQNHQ